MSGTFTGEDAPLVDIVNGRRHYTWFITALDVEVVDEVQVKVPFSTFTVTFLEGNLEIAGAATTIDPDIGDKAGFVVDTPNHKVSHTPPAVFFRDQENVRVILPKKRLFIRINPDNTADKVTLVLTLVEGHLEQAG